MDKKLRKEISDIAECPICTETMKDPRSLPCLHSFCLECLKNCAKGKKEGDKLPCPVCRSTMILQSSNLSYLPVSHIINKIVDASKLSGTDEHYCTICLILNKEIQAFQYCVECGDHFCNDCAKCHSVQKVTKGHKIVSLNEPHSQRDLLKMRANLCSIHDGETIKFYCYDCQITSCVICYVSNHKEHKCTDVAKAAEEKRNQIDATASVLNEQKVESQNILKQVFESEKNLTERGKMLQKEIEGKYAELLAKLNSDRDQSYHKLSELESARKQELVMIMEACNCEIISMNDIEKLWEEIKTNGNACDILETAESIRRRFVDIKSNHQKEFSKHSSISKPDYFNLEFVKTKLSSENLLGHMISQKSRIYPGTDFMGLRNTKPEILCDGIGGSVVAIAALEDQLFMIAEDHCILSYNINDPYTAPFCIKVENLMLPFDIISSPSNSFLFISDRGYLNDNGQVNYNQEKKLPGPQLIRVSVEKDFLKPENKAYLGEVSGWRATRRNNYINESACRSSLNTYGSDDDNYPQDCTHQSHTSHTVRSSSLLTWHIKYGEPLQMSATENDSLLVLLNSEARSKDPCRTLARGPRGGYSRGGTTAQYRSLMDVFDRNQRGRPNQNYSTAFDQRLTNQQGNYVYEYDFEGRQLRKFSVGQCRYARHVVQLHNGNYAFCCVEPNFHLSVADERGDIVKKLGFQPQGKNKKNKSVSDFNDSTQTSIIVGNAGNMVVWNSNEHLLYALNDQADLLGSIKYPAKLEHIINSLSLKVTCICFSTAGNKLIIALSDGKLLRWKM